MHNRSMEEPFDPYLQWLAIRDPKRPPNHYRLLGIDLFESDVEVIQNAADRQMTHVRRFQGGRHSIESQRLLNELASAKICLLQPEKKAVYDASLHAERLTSPRPLMPPPLIRGRDFSTPPPIDLSLPTSGRSPVAANVHAPAEVILIPSRPLLVVKLERESSNAPNSAPKNRIVSLSLFLCMLGAVLAVLVGLFVLLSNANKKKEAYLPTSQAIQTVEKPHTSNPQ